MNLLDLKIRYEMLINKYYIHVYHLGSYYINTCNIFFNNIFLITKMSSVKNLDENRVQQDEDNKS